MFRNEFRMALKKFVYHDSTFGWKGPYVPKGLTGLAFVTGVTLCDSFDVIASHRT